MIRISVQREPIDLAAELAALEDGAVATFSGHVRADDGVTTLELEHYPVATEAALTRLAEEASVRWSLSAAVVIHRVGPMAPGERIVLVATASASSASRSGAGRLCLSHRSVEDQRAVLET